MSKNQIIRVNEPRFEIPADLKAQIKARQPKPVEQEPPRVIQPPGVGRDQAGRALVQANERDELLKNLGLTFKEQDTEYTLSERKGQAVDARRNGPELEVGAYYQIVMLKDHFRVKSEIFRSGNNDTFKFQEQKGDLFIFSNGFHEIKLGLFPGRHMVFKRLAEGVEEPSDTQSQVLTEDELNRFLQENLKVTFDHEKDTGYEGEERTTGTDLVQGKEYAIVLLKDRGRNTLEVIKHRTQYMGKGGHGFFYFANVNPLAIHRGRDVLFINLTDRKSDVKPTATAIQAQPELKAGDKISLNDPNAKKLIEKHLKSGDKCKVTYQSGTDAIITFIKIEKDLKHARDNFYYHKEGVIKGECYLPMPFPITIELLDQSDIPNETKQKLGNPITLRRGENPTGKLTKEKSYLCFQNEQPLFKSEPHKLHSWNKMDDGVYCLEFETGGKSSSGDPYLFMHFLDSSHSPYSFREVSV